MKSELHKGLETVCNRSHFILANLPGLAGGAEETHKARLRRRGRSLGLGLGLIKPSSIGPL